MTNASQRLVLVAGGTGNQGGATVAHLLERRLVRVRVLTRDPSSAKAKALESRGVHVVGGDFDDPASLKTALSGVSAAFSVQNFFDKGGVEAEARRGIAFADAAKEATVDHFVYSSVDGAERKSGVPHFDSKWKIEQHIGALGLRSTILRPVAFMDGFRTSSFARAMFLGMLRAALGASKRLQLVATTDIGWFGARALEAPDLFAGRALALAGDELTVPEILDTYQRVTGRRPSPFPFPKFLLGLMPKEMSSMFDWFAAHGYEAQIPALRKEHPGLLSLKEWLKLSTLPRDISSKAAPAASRSQL